MAQEIGRAFSLAATVHQGSVRIEVPDSGTFVPRLFQELQEPVTSFSLHRPSLDDVFLKLTGRAIRDEEAGGTDQLRDMAKLWRGARR
jgi:ABC-2 type transport system ATP-binding protein